MYTDTIADLLTRIRNAQLASHKTVLVPASRMTKGVLEVLKKEGFIDSFLDKGGDLEAKKGRARLKYGSFEVLLKYYESGDPLISTIERISTPGKRVYSSVERLPRVSSGLGISVLSTSKGLLSDREARKLGIGGEVIARVG